MQLACLMDKVQNYNHTIYKQKMSIILNIVREYFNVTLMEIKILMIKSRFSKEKQRMFESNIEKNYSCSALIARLKDF